MTRKSQQTNNRNHKRDRKISTRGYTYRNTKDQQEGEQLDENDYDELLDHLENVRRKNKK